MPQEHILNIEAQQKILSGVNKLANIVKLTLGPKGKNVVIDKKFSSPLITNDGVTIAREFEVADPLENVGAKIIKEVSQKTNDTAGDGTTTATILAQNILHDGVKHLINGENPININIGLELATNFCERELKKRAKKIATNYDIQNIATISCQNKEIGMLLAKAYDKLGKNCNIILQDSQTAETYLTYQEGLKIERGFLSPHFCNNQNKTQVNFNDCYLLLYEGNINSFNKLLPILEQILKVKKPLVIICDEIEQEVLSALLINKMHGNFECVVIKSPMYADKKTALLEDLACLANTTVFNNTTKILEEVSLTELGLLKQAKITKDFSTFVCANIDKNRLKSRESAIKSQIENSQNDFDKTSLQNRLSNLTGGIATIFVGAQSDVEQKEKKLRIEDAISATKSAIELGIVAGGGTALLKLTKPLEKFIKKLSPEYKLGANIVKNTLSAPLKQILKNAGVDASIVLNKLNSKSNINFGFDAMTNKFCDMINAGIIDPVKVTINALKFATSVSKTLLTTGGIICEVE